MSAPLKLIRIHAISAELAVSAKDSITQELYISKRLTIQSSMWLGIKEAIQLEYAASA